MPAMKNEARLADVGVILILSRIFDKAVSELLVAVFSVVEHAHVPRALPGLQLPGREHLRKSPAEAERRSHHHDGPYRGGLAGGIEGGEIPAQTRSNEDGLIPAGLVPDHFQLA